jgi:hypothetical protein
MFDLRKLFVKEAASRERADYGGAAEGLEIEYQRLVTTQFRRLGIHEDCVTIDVRRIGHGPHGFDVLVGMVRLHRWERTSGLRLLIGLPLIESRVRKLVRSTWLADYSHFGGLWLHAAEHLHEEPGTEELRELLMTLTPPHTSATETPAPHPFAHADAVPSDRQEAAQTDGLIRAG